MDAQFVEWSHTLDPDHPHVQTATELLGTRPSAVLDIGGGVGQFAKAIANSTEATIDIVDPSATAAERFQPAPRVQFIHSPFETFESDQNYDAVTARLVLHHLVGDSRTDCDENVANSLSKIRHLLSSDIGQLVVFENVYDGPLGSDVPGTIIYSITRSKRLAGLSRKLGANTAGVGVRFRSDKGWRQLFKSAGFEVVQTTDNANWLAYDWRLAPLLCVGRRQTTYVLRPISD